MKSKYKWGTVALGCAGVVTGALAGGRAWAGGIPAAGALTYSGLLQDANGAPLTGTQYVEVKFWKDAASTAAADALCDTGTATGIGLVNGRFSIALPDKCATQVASNSGIWAEVIVGSTANAAASLGRTKLGAVPFAVEANHALAADSATNAANANAATGALQTTLSQMQTAISALQAVKPLTTISVQSLNLTDASSKSWQSFAAQCIAADSSGASTLLDACLVAASRKCAGSDGLGYQMGWPTGELASGIVQIVCIK